MKAFLQVRRVYGINKSQEMMEVKKDDEELRLLRRIF
jgi:hypothetical protein